ncbi:MAG: peptidase M10, partial [Ferruginibacter sp.]
MGEVELLQHKSQLIIHATLFFYGDVASEHLSLAIARDVAAHWNEPKAAVYVKRNLYLVLFDITGIYSPALLPQEVYENDSPVNNY